MRCSFCDSEIGHGTGTVYATRIGDILTFCSSKCERNMLRLGRKPQNMPWTGRFAYEKRIRLGGEKIEKAEEVKAVAKAEKKGPGKKERREARKQKKLALKAEKVKRKEEKAKAAEPKPEGGQ
jgi:large subunit ribosomal protein L24e